MTAAKICGLTRPDDAAAALEAGAGYLGVIFAGGPRALTAEVAAVVLGERSTAKRVGVFGDQSSDDIARIAERAKLDVIQLHADPTPEIAHEVRRRTALETWVAMRIANNVRENELDELISSADAVLFDTRVDHTLGGSGRPFDWAVITKALTPHRRKSARIVLAGGLTPANVGAAIGAVRPDVVDVSSGVEVAPGVKDHGLVRAFVAAAREAQ